MARTKTARRRSAARAKPRSTRAAKPRGKRTAKARAAARPRGRFVCPDCGFKAKHAMGLGRHRSARHGVMSKRQQMRRRTGTGFSQRDARASAEAVRAVRDLEKRFDQLLSALDRLVSGARARGRGR